MDPYTATPKRERLPPRVLDRVMVTVCRRVERGEKYAVDAYDFDPAKFAVLDTPVAVFRGAGEYVFKVM